MATAAPASDDRLKRLHHLEHMEGELAARAVGPARADRLRHVGEAEDAVVAVGVGVLGRDLAPVLGRGRDLDLAAEIIRVGNDQRARLAVDLDRDDACAARRRSSSSSTPPRRSTKSSAPVTWVATSTGMRVPAQRLAGDDALGRGARRDAADARDGTEQVDEVGDVVGAHVEHRAAAARGSRSPDWDASARGPGT